VFAQEGAQFILESNFPVMVILMKNILTHGLKI